MAADYAISNAASSRYLISTWIEKGSLYGKRADRKETVGGGIVLTFEEMEVILNGFIIKIKQIAFMMQSHMGQASGIVGECTLAFTGYGY